MSDKLAAAFTLPDTFDSATWRSAVVDDADPIQVTIAAQTGLSASWLQAYTENNPPSGEDQVLVIQTKTDVIIVGRIINGGE